MLEGSINTPVGNVSKKTAAIVAGGVVILGVIVWVRGRKTAANEALAAAGQADVNPATGYPFGSAEDAAALAAQASYVSPVGGGVGGIGGGSGGATSTSPGTFGNNAQWSQFVQQYMTDNQIVSDGSLLASALGKYLGGRQVSTDENNLIQQAIAFGGFPPIAGTNGYPPAINVSASPPPTQPAPMPAPTGISATLVGPGRIAVNWNPVPGATLYTIGVRLWGSPIWSQGSGFDLLYKSGPTSSWQSAGFTKGQGYDFYIAANDAQHKEGPFAGPAKVLVSQ